MAALLLAGLSLGACNRQPAPPPEPVGVAPPKPLPAPLPPPAVSRNELLAAIGAARAAYAAGQPDASPGLSGRRFTLRQAFGCAALGTTSAPTAGVANWTWGKDQKTFEVSLTPADWTSAPALEGETTWEAAEGYWLTRPWLQAEGCPAPRASIPAPPVDGATPRPAVALTPTPLNSGLAAVFAKDSSRVSRRDGKPFTLTVRSESPLAPPPNGYRLVVEGRFAAFSDGRAIRCTAPDADQAPVCVAAAEVDRVAFEDADGKVLKEWRQG